MGSDLHVVTGAFGYSGKYIASRLLAAGCRVRTLTNSLSRQNPFGADVEARPYNFDRPDDLVNRRQWQCVALPCKQENKKPVFMVHGSTPARLMVIFGLATVSLVLDLV